ncbi:MAG: hypothetical protein JSS04_25590 [Proteobacteria bacterium]|nr:hypothetical protein [Pseudomonadota bacterium]
MRALCWHGRNDVRCGKVADPERLEIAVEYIRSDCDR